MAPLSFLDGKVILHPGDCREVLRSLPDASIDSVVTDPPYALVSIGKRFGKPGSAPALPGKGEGATGAYARASAGFMGQGWDTGETAFSVAFWAEVLRALKPGGHLVAFSGTRTYHRMVCAIEDGGFEIRDQLAWAYGSGFPKSHDVSKGIQKRRLEDVAPIRAVCRSIRAAMDAKGLKSRHLTVHFGDCHPRLVDHWAARDSDSQPALPTWDQWGVLKGILNLGDAMDAEVWRLNGRKGEPGAAWADAEVIGEYKGQTPGLVGKRFSDADRTIRVASSDAEAWQGWGTAMKPAWEPIVLARKPLAGTVADNVVQHGTGALNIDGCRVGDAKAGRWPANIVHDGSDEVLSAFPEAPGQLRGVTGAERAKRTVNAYGDFGETAHGADPRADSGSAARFFYSAKADADDRLGSKHPTVKPVDLMQWLCRLVTPPGGTVLDPFAGTGTTGEAAFREGFRAVLIEREPQFQADIARRMELALAGPATRKAESVKARAKDEEPLPLFADGEAA